MEKIYLILYPILIGLTALIGQFMGLVLAKISPEELKPGKRYFILLKNLLLVSIAVVCLYYNFDIVYLVLGLILGMVIKREYLYFGLVSKNILLASLIFIYGLPYGTLKAENKKLLIMNVILFLLAFISTFIFYKLSLYSLVGGGLIANVILNRFRS